MNTWQIFFKSKSITFLFSDLFSNSVVYSLNKLNIRFIWSWGMRPEGISFDSGPNQGNWHANLKHVNIQYFLIWLKKYIKLAGTNIQNWLLFGLFFFKNLRLTKSVWSVQCYGFQRVFWLALVGHWAFEKSSRFPKRALNMNLKRKHKFINQLLCCMMQSIYIRRHM